MRLALRVLPGAFAICRLPADASVPDWAQGEWLSITRTLDELSIVCEQARVPHGVQADRDWRCLQVQGPLDLALIGILAALTAPLAQARIGVFAVSTYDTDYLLIQECNLDQAVRVLREADFEI